MVAEGRYLSEGSMAALDQDEDEVLELAEHPGLPAA